MLLMDGAIVQHAFVIGELVVGSLTDRNRTIARWRGMHRLPTADENRYLAFLDDNELSGTGLGFVDVHLLISVASSRGTTLWTGDKRLLTQAERIGISLHS